MVPITGDYLQERISRQLVDFVFTWHDIVANRLEVNLLMHRIVRS